MLVSLLLTPYVLLIVSQNYHRHHYERTRANYFIIPFMSAMLLLSVGLFIRIRRYDPYGPDRPQPVEVTEVVDYGTASRRISLESTRPMGDLRLELDGRDLLLTDLPRTAEVRAALPPDLLEVNVERDSFLDRQLLDIRIRPEGQPESISLTLESADPITVYGCSYPYTVSADRRTALIHIGRNPPVPLDLDLTLTRDSSAALRLEVAYETSPYPLDLTGTDISWDRTLIVRQRQDLTVDDDTDGG